MPFKLSTGISCPAVHNFPTWQLPHVADNIPPMRWLLHGRMSHAVAEGLRRHGHSVESIENPPQSAGDLIKLAQEKQLDIMTTDGSLLAAAGGWSGRFDRSIVYLQLETADEAQSNVIDRLFERYKRLTPGRIYTVTASRVKVRQLPNAGKPRAPVKSLR